MQYFAVHYTYVNDTELIARHRPDHRAFLSSLTDKGLIAGGAYPEATPPSALLVVKAENAEASPICSPTIRSGSTMCWPMSV